MNKILNFDMDGTIADLYNVPDWLPMLRAEDTTPYEVAKPMVSMLQFNYVLSALKSKGCVVTIITHYAIGSSDDYSRRTKRAKRKWVKDCGIPYDHFHCQPYGTPKEQAIKNYRKGAEAILFDDNEEIRNKWTVGETVDPATTDIIEYLLDLLVEGE